MNFILLQELNEMSTPVIAQLMLYDNSPGEELGETFASSSMTRFISLGYFKSVVTVASHG